MNPFFASTEDIYPPTDHAQRSLRAIERTIKKLRDCRQLNAQRIVEISNQLSSGPENTACKGKSIGSTIWEALPNCTVGRNQIIRPSVQGQWAAAQIVRA